MITKASSSNDTNTKRCAFLSHPPHADSAAHNRHAHTSDHTQPQSTITQREPHSCSMNHANSRKQCGPAPSNKARRVPSESTRGRLSAVQSSHEPREITMRTRNTERGQQRKRLIAHVPFLFSCCCLKSRLAHSKKRSWLTLV